MAAKSNQKGFTLIEEIDGIKEYRLESNKLRVLLAKDPASLVAGCMVTYHVGSRNEAIGHTGATHMLEHLMFKGSKNFNKETKSTVWDLLETKGARVNATTWFDRTNYYEVVPAEYLPTAIALEADRMRTARILESDRQSEMTVVRNEFERGENESTEALDKQIWAIAYQAHPYHHSTIGWRSDIEGVSIERLNQFYNDFYWPNNATVTIAGNFDEQVVLNLIAKEFGVHSKAPHEFPKMYTQEPPQEGERRVLVRRAGSDMVGVAHKIPNAHHKDMAALATLAGLLTDGKTSRLYRALVDTGKALYVGSYPMQLMDPSLFITYVTLKPGADHAKLEGILKDEYNKVADKGITSAELAKAKRNVRVDMAQRRNGTYAFLSSLNEEIATGDWKRFVEFPKALAAVTTADVKRVAKTYFLDDQSTVGWLLNTAK